MVKHFRFEVQRHAGPNGWVPTIDNQLGSHRCGEQTRAGNRCSRQCVMGIEMCWQHLLAVRLRIQASTLPGAEKGLFALVKNQPQGAVLFDPAVAHGFVLPYNGDALTNQQRNHRYPLDYRQHLVEGPYLERIIPNHYVDGALNRSVASFAKRGPVHGGPVNRRANATVIHDAHGNLEIRATRRLLNPTEIILNYDGQHHATHPTTRYRTK